MSSQVALGPLTNIALAMKLDPGFSRRPKKVIIMGGNYLGGLLAALSRILFCSGTGNAFAGHTAEWNFHGDPEAAAIVLEGTMS